MRLGLHPALAWAAPLWLLAAFAHAAEPILIFGLTNVPLGDAVFTRTAVGLQINLNGTNTDAAAWPLPPAGSVRLFNGISTNEIPTNGLSVFLGEADSGFFFYPRKDDAALDNGWFLLGRAYGRVNGSNDQLICTLSGIRNDWGLYGVGVDFTPLGATSQTWQVYCERTLIAQATNRGTTASISTYDVESRPPRVNPLWRSPNGQIGAYIDFPDPTLLFFDTPANTNCPGCVYPRGASAVGNRFYIQPERCTSRVDFVSRVDVFGGGGLPWFATEDERLGMFNLPHRSLGDAVLKASGGELTLTNLGSSGNDGVLVELDATSGVGVQFRSRRLDQVNTSLSISAVGEQTGSLLTPNVYFGDAVVRNSGARLETVVDLEGAGQTQALVAVYQDGTLQGSAIVSGGVVGSFGTDDVAFSGVGAVASTAQVPPYLYFNLEQAATFILANSQAFQGNQLRVGAPGTVTNFAHLSAFHVRTKSLPALTITNETTLAARVPGLAIERQSRDAVVSWPYPAACFLLQGSDQLGSSDAWSGDITNKHSLLDGRIHYFFPIETNSGRFFRLKYAYDYYLFGL